MSQPLVLWTNFHHVDRQKYARIQLQIALICVGLTFYFGFNGLAALFVLTWIINVLAQIPELNCDVQETPKATDFDRIMDLVKRLLCGGFFCAVFVAYFALWSGLVAVAVQYAIYRWAPKEVRILRGVIIFWPFR
jgi:hypothetical protein